MLEIQDLGGRYASIRPRYKYFIRKYRDKISIGKHTTLGRGSRVYAYNGTMAIGKNTTICNYSKFILGSGNLIIGNDCLLGEYGVYNTFSNIIIGNNVLTADRINYITNIHTYNDVTKPIKEQPSVSKSIEIGDGTWIGINVTLLAGTKVGKNCVIGANAVVKGAFPDYCVIAGVPAHVIKRYLPDQKKWVRIFKDEELN